jgi:predicted signal transduction protein with EAL and GGDEF domain
LRGYLFTDRDRERLRLWLESGVEDDGTRMLFVGVRRSMGRIVGDVELLVAVARRLRAVGRMMGRARLPGDLGEAVRRVEKGIRGRRGRS